MRTLIPTVVLLSLIPFSLFASARSNSGGLPERVAELEAQVERITELEAQVEILAAALHEAQEILQYVRVETGEIVGVTGPHWIIEGANVHIVSGIPRTYGLVCPGGSSGWCVSSNGLGNLIVGYNEFPYYLGTPKRSGMHNLIVGPEHEYQGHGGFLAGRHNSLLNRGASVTGGIHNRARGFYSSVSGGAENLAYESAASVSGGFRNIASGVKSSVSGGEEREAPDDYNWVAGELFEPN
jgi:hypothetical protein